MMDMGLVQRSIYGGILILIIIAVRVLLLDKLPKRTFPVLWGIALLRLLVPFSVASVFSVYTLLGLGRQEAAPAREAYVVSGEMEAMDLPPEKGSGQPPVRGQETAVVEARKQMEILPVLWCAGALICGAFFARSYIRSLDRFRKAVPVESEQVLQWMERHRRGRPVFVRQAEGISTPLTYGCLRPVILLPEKALEEKGRELEYILEHEYVHICYCDALMKLVMVAALCVHWFNPLVWVMYVLANRDLELSCDERVMDALGGREKASYALTLINMEEARSRCFSPYNHFSKLAIEERIEAIMKYKKASVLALILAIVLVVGATTAFATSPEVEEGKADGTIVLAPTGFGRAADSKKADASKVNTATIQAGEENMFGKVTTENDKKADDAEAGSAAGILTGKPSSKVSIAAGSTISYTFGSGPDKTYYEKGTEIEVVIQCVYKDIPLEVSLIRKGDSEAVESHKVEGSKQTTLCFTVPADGEYYIWVKNCSLSRTQEYSSVLSR